MQGGLEQVAFVADGKKLKTGKEFPHIKCFKCGKYGHYKIKEIGGETCQIIQVTTLMTGAVLMTNKEGINPMWIICDNESLQ